MLSGSVPFDVSDGIDSVGDTPVIEFPVGNWTDVSEEAKDLIRHLLVVDPRKRLNIIAASQHPWVITDDGDTHIHPLDDPKVKALCCTKQLYDKTEAEPDAKTSICDQLTKQSLFKGTAAISPDMQSAKALVGEFPAIEVRGNNTSEGERALNANQSAEMNRLEGTSMSEFRGSEIENFENPPCESMVSSKTSAITLTGRSQGVFFSETQVNAFSSNLGSTPYDEDEIDSQFSDNTESIASTFSEERSDSTKENTLIEIHSKLNGEKIKKCRASGPVVKARARRFRLPKVPAESVKGKENASTTGRSSRRIKPAEPARSRGKQTTLTTWMSKPVS
jgi:serine/threonine protein kinase